MDPLDPQDMFCMEPLFLTSYPLILLIHITFLQHFPIRSSLPLLVASPFPALTPLPLSNPSLPQTISIPYLNLVLLLLSITTTPTHPLPTTTSAASPSYLPSYLPYPLTINPLTLLPTLPTPYSSLTA